MNLQKRVENYTPLLLIYIIDYEIKVTLSYNQLQCFFDNIYKL
jgi:hypothetical protein